MTEDWNLKKNDNFRLFPVLTPQRGGSEDQPSVTRNHFPRVRGAVSSAVLEAKLRPSGLPTTKELQKTPLKPPDGATWVVCHLDSGVCQ